VGLTLLTGPTLIAVGCHVPPPQAEQVFAYGFRTPGQAVESFRTAFQARVLEREYMCFSSAFKARRELGIQAAAVCRDERAARHALFRWALYKACVTIEHEPGATRARAVARYRGLALELLLVQEGYYELWTEAGRELDRNAPDLSAEALRWDTDQGRLFGFVAPERAIDPGEVTDLRFGREWKIDDFRVLEDQDA
jgi:hypothetical protein